MIKLIPYYYIIKLSNKFEFMGWEEGTLKIIPSNKLPIDSINGIDSHDSGVVNRCNMWHAAPEINTKWNNVNAFYTEFRQIIHVVHPGFGQDIMTRLKYFHHVISLYNSQ